MAGKRLDTEDLRGAQLRDVDMRGATIRNSDLRELKITASWLHGARVSGEIDGLVVNDVDVTPFVAAELDRRHPERAQLREMATADDHRAMWRTLEQLWSDTVDRARQLPEPAVHERVDGEWSFVETLRHLVFATDAWAGSAILEQPPPFHRLGLPHSSYPPGEAAALGIDLGARPTLDEVLDARADRQALVRGIVEGLTDDGLQETRARPPAPGYDDEVRTVRHCLEVVMHEETEHRRYATRDLATLESR